MKNVDRIGIDEFLEKLILEINKKLRKQEESINRLGRDIELIKKSLKRKEVKIDKTVLNVLKGKESA